MYFWKINMLTIKNITGFAVSFFVLLNSTLLIAEPANARGKVLKFTGDVEVVNVNGESRTITSVDMPLNEMDTIVTKKGSRVVVRFDDGALSVLDEKSRLRVEKTSWFSYLGGKVYFTFKKVFGEPRRVKTRAATIGVRGTTFIISDVGEQEGESVALKEGLLQIESTGPNFEIHKKKILDEFEQFKLEQQRAKADVQDEFEKYKQQAMEDFIEYQHEFTLQPNRVINLSGYRVDEKAMNAADEKDFETFESEAEDLIKSFREQADKFNVEEKEENENASEIDE